MPNWPPVETSARLAHDLKEALHARDAAESQLKEQTEALSLKLSQAKEDAAREVEKAARQEKHRLERQQLEFDKDAAPARRGAGTPIETARAGIVPRV